MFDRKHNKTHAQRSLDENEYENIIFPYLLVRVTLEIIGFEEIFPHLSTISYLSMFSDESYGVRSFGTTFWVVRGGPGVHLGASKGGPGGVLGNPGAVRRSPGGVLEGSRALLGRCWDDL